MTLNELFEVFLIAIMTVITFYAGFAAGWDFKNKNRRLNPPPDKE